MVKRLFAPVTLVVVILVFALGFTVSSATAGAQGTPAAPRDQEAVGPYPAHIHSGSCDELGEIVFPLNPLTRVSADVPPGGTPVEGIPTAEVALDATPVEAATTDETTLVAGSSTIVDASLEDILADQHAINVHQSPENLEDYIACGNLPSEATDGEVRIELQELDNSGYTGVAHLQDNEDGTTTVTVGLMLTGNDTTGTP